MDAMGQCWVLDLGVHARVARALRGLAAELHLARRGQPDDLHDLAVVVVEGRLRDRERPPGACLGERDLDGTVPGESGLRDRRDGPHGV